MGRKRNINAQATGKGYLSVYKHRHDKRRRENELVEPKTRNILGNASAPFGAESQLKYTKRLKAEQSNNDANSSLDHFIQEGNPRMTYRRSYFTAIQKECLGRPEAVRKNLYRFLDTLALVTLFEDSLVRKEYLELLKCILKDHNFGIDDKILRPFSSSIQAYVIRSLTHTNHSIRVDGSALLQLFLPYPMLLANGLPEICLLLCEHTNSNLGVRLLLHYLNLISDVLKNQEANGKESKEEDVRSKLAKLMRNTKHSNNAKRATKTVAWKRVHAMIFSVAIKNFVITPADAMVPNTSDERDDTKQAEHLLDVRRCCVMLLIQLLTAGFYFNENHLNLLRVRVFPTLTTPYELPYKLPDAARDVCAEIRYKTDLLVCHLVGKLAKQPFSGGPLPLRLCEGYVTAFSGAITCHLRQTNAIEAMQATSSGGSKEKNENLDSFNFYSLLCILWSSLVDKDDTFDGCNISCTSRECDENRSLLDTCISRVTSHPKRKALMEFTKTGSADFIRKRKDMLLRGLSLVSASDESSNLPVEGAPTAFDERVILLVEEFARRSSTPPADVTECTERSPARQQLPVSSTLSNNSGSYRMRENNFLRLFLKIQFLEMIDEIWTNAFTPNNRDDSCLRKPSTANIAAHIPILLVPVVGILLGVDAEVVSAPLNIEYKDLFRSLNLCNAEVPTGYLCNDRIEKWIHTLIEIILNFKEDSIGTLECAFQVLNSFAYKARHYLGDEGSAVLLNKMEEWISPFYGAEKWDQSLFFGSSSSLQTAAVPLLTHFHPISESLVSSVMKLILNCKSYPFSCESPYHSSRPEDTLSGKPSAIGVQCISPMIAKQLLSILLDDAAHENYITRTTTGAANLFIERTSIVFKILLDSYEQHRRNFSWENSTSFAPHLLDLVSWYVVKRGHKEASFMISLISETTERKVKEYAESNSLTSHLAAADMQSQIVKMRLLGRWRLLQGVDVYRSKTCKVTSSLAVCDAIITVMQFSALKGITTAWIPYERIWEYYVTSAGLISSSTMEETTNEMIGYGCASIELYSTETVGMAFSLLDSLFFLASAILKSGPLLSEVCKPRNSREQSGLTLHNGLLSKLMKPQEQFGQAPAFLPFTSSCEGLLYSKMFEFLKKVLDIPAIGLLSSTRQTSYALKREGFKLDDTESPDRPEANSQSETLNSVQSVSSAGNNLSDLEKVLCTAEFQGGVQQKIRAHAQALESHLREEAKAGEYALDGVPLSIRLLVVSVFHWAVLYNSLISLPELDVSERGMLHVLDFYARFVDWTASQMKSCLQNNDLFELLAAVGKRKVIQPVECWNSRKSAKALGPYSYDDDKQNELESMTKKATALMDDLGVITWMKIQFLTELLMCGIMLKRELTSSYGESISNSVFARQAEHARHLLEPAIGAILIPLLAGLDSQEIPKFPGFEPKQLLSMLKDEIRAFSLVC